MEVLRRSLFFMVFFWLISGVARAESNYHTTFFGNLAVSGYDTVAYFTMNKAIKGKKKFTYKWNGANWRFISQEHLDLFIKNPEKYAPQYGGHCAWAVSEKNMLYRGSPTTWEIIDNRLYLNHNTSIEDRWLEEVRNHIEQADTFWADVHKQK